MTQTIRELQVGKVGDLVPRADAPPKVQGKFAYASDLIAAGMLFATAPKRTTSFRAPYPISQPRH